MPIDLDLPKRLDIFWICVIFLVNENEKALVAPRELSKVMLDALGRRKIILRFL